MYWTLSEINRPDHQREHIELALQIVLWILSEFWIDEREYDPKNIIFIDSCSRYLGRNTVWNITEIDISSSFDISTYIHEIVHAFSRYEYDDSQGRVITKLWYQSTVWFFENRSDNRITWTTYETHRRGFNEGITDLITLDAVRQNINRIEALKEKYKKIMEEYEKLYQSTNHPKANIFGLWCQRTWWKTWYRSEMRLVTAIVDLIAYKRAGKAWDTDRYKDDVWTDLVFWYFTNNYTILKSLLKEADSSWKLNDTIEELYPRQSQTEKIIAEIRTQIQTVFNPRYRLSPIPKKLKKAL